MIQINTIPYKIVYEGSYRTFTFEYNVFDGDKEILWLEGVPPFVEEVEKEIHNYYYNNI